MWVSTWCWGVLVATLFLLLEAMSFLFELMGRNRLGFRIGSFVLSAFALGMVIIMNNGNMTELVFSFVQLITTWVYLVLPLFNSVSKFSLHSIYPLVLAATTFVLAFRRREAEEGPAGDLQENLEATSNDDARVAGDHTGEITTTAAGLHVAMMIYIVLILINGHVAYNDAELAVDRTRETAILPQGEEFHISIDGAGLAGDATRVADVQGNPQAANMGQSEEISISIGGTVGATNTDI